MSIMTKFESAMQGLFEGSFGRVFRTKLQPIEISRKLERAMEEHLIIGPDRRLAPNLYEVYLSPRDYAQFAPYARSLVQQLSDSLITVARDRGYMLTSRPVVRFHEAEHIVTGQLRVHAQMLDAQAVLAPGTQAEEDEVGVEATRAMSQEEARELEQVARGGGRGAPQAEPMPPAWLTLLRPSRGQPMRLERPIIHLGRHLSNDIVVNDRRVSRYHAEIRAEHGQFVLYDLGSTNGVKVNGVASRQPVPLRNNDMLSVGSHDFIFQRR